MKSIQYLKENNVDVDKSLELFGDMDMYNSTMRDFLEHIDSKLENLKKFKDINEIENYAIFAHSIKSDARYLGFTSVAEIALKHEMAGKEDNQKFILDNYEDFMQIVKEMISTVTKYLDEEPDIREYNVTGNKNKIVVVDDSTLITNLVKRGIEDAYDLVVYNDSKEALDYILKHNNEINVLLLDLNMPELNGFDILEKMKEQDLFKEIKVSIITGDESKETINKAFLYPIVDMLNKPFSVQNLINVIEKTSKN